MFYLYVSAAAFVFGTVEEATSADWDRVLGVNVKVCGCLKYGAAKTAFAASEVHSDITGLCAVC